MFELSGEVPQDAESRIPPVPEESCVDDTVPDEAPPPDPADAEASSQRPEINATDEEEAEQMLQQSETIATTPVAPDHLKTVVDIQTSFRVCLSHDIQGTHGVTEYVKCLRL